MGRGKKVPVWRARAPNSNFHVLRKKELESYLINAEAISTLVGKRPEEVEQIVRKSKSSGKETLNSIFQLAHVTKPDSNVKELLAIYLSELDDEISTLISKIQEEIRK